MNFNKFLNSSYLKENPLCGISTYKDTLNLATGACTRQIRKLVLTGDEGWGGSSRFRIGLSGQIGTIAPICTHYRGATTAAYAELADGRVTVNGGTGLTLAINDSVNQSSLTAWKTYLAQQYANGTPVTVWYVLATPTTETITVPSGLSGTEEGYLNQSGTPTPTNPIYPTANTVEKWFDIPHYIMGTDTDTLTILPAVLYPNDTTATVGLKGDMSQTGTPTPQTPIQPQECGERTGNLYQSIRVANGWVVGYRNPHNGQYTSINGYGEWLSPKIPILAGDEITISAMSMNTPSMSVYFWNGDTYISSLSATDYTGSTFTAPEGTTQIDFAIRAGANKKSEKQIISNGFWVMVNVGSTPLPYEPYGYKIPISSANTTTPVYFGEVQTTRQIKKLVLDGTENVSYNSRNDTRERWVVTIPTANGTTIPENVICTHFETVNATTKPLSEGGICMRSTGNDVIVGGIYTDIGITAPSDSTTIVNAVKAYLAQQYAADTPVCVWYVLATEETAVVNEPIRKIGDYADEVSGITIPTIAGANTISIGTTLQPSEVTVNYKGWHPVQSVHERESGEWD